MAKIPSSDYPTSAMTTNLPHRLFSRYHFGFRQHLQNSWKFRLFKHANGNGGWRTPQRLTEEVLLSLLLEHLFKRGESEYFNSKNVLRNGKPWKQERSSDCVRNAQLWKVIGQYSTSQFYTYFRRVQFMNFLRKKDNTAHFEEFFKW